jgi:hypothetical protein
MKIETRHYCRKCRVKLPEPVDNEHHAFCTKGCLSSFITSAVSLAKSLFELRADRSAPSQPNALI